RVPAPNQPSERLSMVGALPLLPGSRCSAGPSGRQPSHALDGRTPSAAGGEPGEAPRSLWLSNGRMDGVASAGAPGPLRRHAALAAIHPAAVASARLRVEAAALR